jgi:type I site-specific restriction endonuclease
MSENIIVSADYTRAVALTRSIIANAQAAQQSLYEVCKGLKEMRDGKLYKELGYANFEDYTENEVGIKHSQAAKYVSIASVLTDEISTRVEQIGVTKLALLAKLDEPTREAVQESVDVESATVKELKAKVKELEASKEAKDKQFQAAMESKDAEIADVRAGWKRRSDTLIEKIQMLNAHIKELEERPVEHDVVDNTEELEALRKERDAARTALADAQKQLAERPMVQEALPVMDSREAFRAYLSAAADSMKRLYGYVEAHRSDTNMPFFLEKVSGIVNLANSELNRLKGE